MEPIRSGTSPPARERLAASHMDAGQPSVDQGASAPAGGPLDGLPARRTASRAQLPPSPANVPAFSEGSFGDLLHEVDLSFFEALPSFSTPHAETASEALDEVQSAQPAAHISDTAPAAHTELSTLGYSKPQQDKIKPQVRAIVAQHHQALIGHGFTHAHIAELSKHPPALGTVAARYPAIIATLPEATHEDIAGVGKQWSGARSLEALLTVTAELRKDRKSVV